MKCKTRWRASDVIELLGKTFYDAYRRRRKEILFDREKTKIPLSMSVISIENNIKDTMNKVDTVRRQIMELLEEESMLMESIGTARAQRDEYLSGTVATASSSDQFTLRCANDKCEAYVRDNDGMCLICATVTCTRCGCAVPDGHSHSCKPTDVASVTNIRDTCRHCPVCRTYIMKISGCAQMWCTMCQTAFDWETGKTIVGPIHNPHYHDAVKRGLVRAHPDHYQPINQIQAIYQSLVKDLHGTAPAEHLTEYLRIAAVIENIVENIETRLSDERTDCELVELQLRWIRRQITDTEYKKRLLVIEQRREKYTVYASTVDIFLKEVNEVFVTLFATSPLLDDASLVCVLNKLISGSNYCADALRTEFTARLFNTNIIVFTKDYPPILTLD